MTGSTKDSGIRLVILLPCYNEAKDITSTLQGLPSRVAGIAQVATLVVDDGSCDGTAELAERAGADVVRLEPHQGLARAWRTGLDAALARGADVIVTMDGDGQYDPDAIPALISPILSGQADLVLGERGLSAVWRRGPGHFIVHRAGALCFHLLSGLRIDDPITGFRAYNHRAATSLQVHNAYTYTLETLMQVRPRALRLESIVVAPRMTVRRSRLYRHPLGYAIRQGQIMVRAFLGYRFGRS